MAFTGKVGVGHDVFLEYRRRRGSNPQPPQILICEQYAILHETKEEGHFRQTKEEQNTAKSLYIAR